MADEQQAINVTFTQPPGPDKTVTTTRLVEPKEAKGLRQEARRLDDERLRSITGVHDAEVALESSNAALTSATRDKQVKLAERAQTARNLAAQARNMAVARTNARIAEGARRVERAAANSERGYFEDIGTARAITLQILGGVGAIYSAELGLRSNPTQVMIDGFIQRDKEKKQRALLNSQDFLKLAREDKEAALQEFKVASLEMDADYATAEMILLKKLEAQIARSKNPEQTSQLIALRRAQAEQKLLNARDKSIQRDLEDARRRTVKAVTKVMTTDKAADKTTASNIVPSFSGKSLGLGDKESVKRIRARLGEVRSTDRMLQELADHVAANGMLRLFPSAARQDQQQTELEVRSVIQKLKSGAAVSEGEMKRIRDTIVPNIWNSVFMSRNQQADTIRRYARIRRDAFDDQAGALVSRPIVGGVAPSGTAADEDRGKSKTQLMGELREAREARDFPRMRELRKILGGRIGQE